MQKWIIFGVIIVIIIISIIIVTNIEVETEYIPESEIEEVEMRKTIISLYFKEKNTNQIVKETRLIDSKELLKDPYSKLVELLKQGPQNADLENVFQDSININEIKYENGSVTIDFSPEFLNVENKDIIIETIEKTLKELTEVTKIKIIVEGNEFQNQDGDVNIIE